MKYESDILKRLIDTYGVVGNPQYISEIIKEFIVQGKECFPNLFTYQSDWLAHIDEFGLKPSYTVSYTGQSIYTPNTLEKPVKSAILKGNTLVNYSNLSKTNILTPNQTVVLVSDLLKTNNEYTLIFNCTSAPSINTFELRKAYNGVDLTFSAINVKSGINKIKIDTTNLTVNQIKIKNSSTSETNFEFKDVLLIEVDYINVDVPYFEGMQSVKMPVLMTKNKQTFVDFEIVPNSGVGVVNETYKDDRSVTLEATGRWARIVYNVKHDNYVSYNLKFDYNATNNFIIDFNGDLGDRIGINSGTGSFSYDFIVKNNEIIHFAFPSGGTVEITNVEFSLSKLKDEPYKTNILTVNEDVTLHGIGDVQDTLDCLTGEIAERIGEMTWDGNTVKWGFEIIGNYSHLHHIQDWGKPNYKTLREQYGLPLALTETNCICKNANITNSPTSGIGICGRMDWGVGKMSIKIPIVFNSKDEAIQWLNENPITFKYQLETESTKTVDLTVLDQNGQNVKQLMAFNGGTHFNTGSSVGSPLPTVSVSVETDLEETLKVCSLDGNTL